MAYTQRCEYRWAVGRSEVWVGWAVNKDEVWVGWAVGIEEQDTTVGVSFTILPCMMFPWPDPRQVSFIASIIKYHAMPVLPFDLILGNRSAL